MAKRKLTKAQNSMLLFILVIAGIIFIRGYGDEQEEFYEGVNTDVKLENIVESVDGE